MTFEEFVAASGSRLLRLAYVLTNGDAQRAEDLLQTALTSAFRHWRRVAAADSPEAYTRRVLVDAYVSERRRRSSSEYPVEAAPDGVGATDPAGGIADRAEVVALLARLAPRARAVLVLRFYGDLDDAAIASELGIAASTVRATASRALATLRSQPVGGREARDA